MRAHWCPFMGTFGLASRSQPLTLHAVRDRGASQTNSRQCTVAQQAHRGWHTNPGRHHRLGAGPARHQASRRGPNGCGTLAIKLVQEDRRWHMDYPRISARLRRCRRRLYFSNADPCRGASDLLWIQDAKLGHSRAEQGPCPCWQGRHSEGLEQGTVRIRRPRPRVTFPMILRQARQEEA